MKREVPTAERLSNALLGCLIGGAIGDAMGSAAEGKSPRESEEQGVRSWKLSDDTQLTFTTCEAIIEAGRPTAESIAAAMLKWYRARRITGLGASTLKALRDLEAGAHWASSGRTGEHAGGNGAAIRIAPLAPFVNLADYSDRQLIRDVCRITHHHEEAYAGALAILVALQAALHGKAASCDQIANQLFDSNVRDRLHEYATCDATSDLKTLATQFGTSGWAVESIPFAIWAAQHATEESFESTLTAIISCGGDTDSNASLAGQIVGARIGFAVLPQNLKNRIPDSSLILNEANRFVNLAVSKGGNYRT